MAMNRKQALETMRAIFRDAAVIRDVELDEEEYWLATVERADGSRYGVSMPDWHPGSASACEGGTILR